MLFVLFLLVAAVQVQGISLKATADHLVLEGTVGEFYAYSDQLVSFYVKADYSVAEVVQGKDHAKIRVVAPSCLEGTEEITVVAQGASEKAEKKIWITHQPREACRNYIQVQPPQLALSKPTSLIFSHAFDPTTYSVRVDAPSKCISVAVGKTAVQKATIFNTGASGTFEVSIGTSHAFADTDRLILQSNEAKEIVVGFRATQEGQVWIPIRLLRGKQEIGSGEVCFQAQHEYAGKLSVPEKLEATMCELTLIDVRLENTGTGAEQYNIQLENNPPAKVILQAGQSAQIQLPLNASELRPNENVVLISAKSAHTEASAPVLVIVKKCEPLVQSSITQSQKADVFTFVATVRNEQDTPLRNVTLQVQGIPADWKVNADSLTIAPHSEANITATVTRTTDEEALPAVLVYANGQKIAEQSMPKIAASPSLTGRIISGAAQNAPWIALGVIALLAALIVLRSSRKEEGKEPPGRQQKLKLLQEEISGEGYVE